MPYLCVDKDGSEWIFDAEPIRQTSGRWIWRDEDDQIVELPKGSRHCNDCDLYHKCKEPDSMTAICIEMWNIAKDRVFFRFSQSLTDKINEK